MADADDVDAPPAPRQWPAFLPSLDQFRAEASRLWQDAIACPLPPLTNEEVAYCKTLMPPEFFSFADPIDKPSVLGFVTQFPAEPSADCIRFHATNATVAANICKRVDEFRGYLAVGWSATKQSPGVYVSETMEHTFTYMHGDAHNIGALLFLHSPTGKKVGKSIGNKVVKRATDVRVAAVFLIKSSRRHTCSDPGDRIHPVMQMTNLPAEYVKFCLEVHRCDDQGRFEGDVQIQAPGGITSQIVLQNIQGRHMAMPPPSSLDVEPTMGTSSGSREIILPVLSQTALKHSAGAGSLGEDADQLRDFSPRILATIKSHSAHLQNDQQAVVYRTMSELQSISVRKSNLFDDVGELQTATLRAG